MSTLQVWRQRSTDHWVVVALDQGAVVEAVLVTSGGEADAYLRSGIGADSDAELAAQVDATQDEFDFIGDAEPEGCPEGSPDAGRWAARAWR